MTGRAAAAENGVLPSRGDVAEALGIAAAAFGMGTCGNDALAWG
jgi:hypothetical protein